MPGDRCNAGSLRRLVGRRGPPRLRTDRANHPSTRSRGGPYQDAGALTGDVWAKHIRKIRQARFLLRRFSGRGRSSMPHRKSRCISPACAQYKCRRKRMLTSRRPCTAKRFLRWLACSDEGDAEVSRIRQRDWQFIWLPALTRKGQDCQLLQLEL